MGKERGRWRARGGLGGVGVGVVTWGANGRDEMGLANSAEPDSLMIMRIILN